MYSWTVAITGFQYRLDPLHTQGTSQVISTIYKDEIFLAYHVGRNLQASNSLELAWPADLGREPRHRLQGEWLDLPLEGEKKLVEGLYVGWASLR